LRRRLALRALLFVIIIATSVAQGHAVSSQLDGFASFGGSVGLMKWMFDVDVSDESRARPMLQGVFRYRINRNWVVAGEAGFGWNDYPEPKDAVTVVFPATFSVQRRVWEPMGVALYAGGGGGIYFWEHKVKGKTFRDPWTENFQKGFEPGLFLTLEGEKQISRQITLTLTLQNHYMFSTHGDELPAAFGEDDDFISARLGVHFHWSPTRGIIVGTPEVPDSGAPPE
jgi:hypothetical protein